MIEKANLIRFYQQIETMEEQKKALGAEVKDAFDAFAKNNGITAQALKKDYKNYQEYQKDAAKFIEVDTEADALAQSWVPEYQERGDGE